MSLRSRALRGNKLLQRDEGERHGHNRDSIVVPALPQPDKVVVLLGIMWEFTLIMSDIALRYPDDCGMRWRLAYHLSEMNHRFASAASAMMKGEATLPGDVLMEILLDQSSYPELETQCRYALDRVIRLHGIKQA